ncbi:MAG: SdrD B-like domain-containing protein [Ilumatobacteraceae bacterium]
MNTRFSGPLRSVNRALAAVAVLGLGVVVVGVDSTLRAPTAAAAPTLTVVSAAPAEVLIDAPATPVTVSAIASNPSGPDGYNVGFKATLPNGVSYVPGSSPFGDPVVIPLLGGITVLWWENVADVLTASSSTVSFQVLAANARFPGNGTVSIPVVAYTNSDPRTTPTLNPATGVIVAGTSSGTGSSTTSTKITAIDIEKSEPSPEGELLRGIHDHETVYTLTITGNGAFPDNTVVVDDYLDAGLEFLGCGAWDNTTDAPTNAGSREEYPGSGLIDATVGPDLAAGAPDNCQQPLLVETVNVDPDGTGPLPLAVYTHVQWSIGVLPVDGVRVISYYAGIPLRKNALFATAPATACSAVNCPQAANLDNNSGTETLDEQPRPNSATAAGKYPGPVAPATSQDVSDTSRLIVSTEDLRMQKGVDAPSIARQGLSHWTIDIATGEYRSVAGPVTVVDTLPDGLCPLGATNFENTSGPVLAECNPVLGEGPTVSIDGGSPTPLPYTSVDENVDGSWTITWLFPAPVYTDNATMRITFPTRSRDFYQQNFTNAAPVLSNDDWTNIVAIPEVQAEVVAPAPGLSGSNPARDDSSASQSSATPAVEKQVGVPLPGNVTVDCNTLSYRDADSVALSSNYYKPGDRVCYHVRLTLNDGAALPPVGSALRYRNIDVSDYLPPGFVFERYWGINPLTGETAADEVVTVTPGALQTTPAGQLMTWKLGGPPAAANRYVDAATEKVFDVIYSATIPAPAPGLAAIVPPGAFLASANLVKATTLNTAGVATSLRNVALDNATRPALGFTKVTPVVNPAGPASTVSYTLTVNNSAPLEPESVGNPGYVHFGAAFKVKVRDALPFELTCADVVVPIPNGGVCTNGVATGLTPSTVSVIDWTIAGPINPQASAVVTYQVKLPVTLAPTEDLTNTAGVRSYEQPVNTGQPPVVYIPPTATTLDPTAVPNDTVPAIASVTVVLADVPVTKVQASSISETGNPSNAPASAATDTVTIGENISYTITATIPAGSTVYAGTFTDALPPNLRLLTSPVAAATLNGTPLPGGWTFVADPGTGAVKVTLPDPYTNAAGSGADVITVTMTAVVIDGAANANGGSFSNKADFSFDTKAATDGVQPTQVRHNTSTVTANIVEPNPTVVKTDDDADKIVLPNQLLNYTLTLGNSGASPAHDLIVTDCVPVGLSVQLPVAAPALGTVAVGGADPSCVSGTFIRWTYPSAFGLAPGSSTLLSYSARVVDPAAASQALTNTVRLALNSTQGANPDERSYSTTATDTVTVISVPLIKSHLPQPATVGQTITYTLEVPIPPNTRLYDAVIVDAMPAGLSFEGLQSVTCAPAVCLPSSATVLGVAGPAPVAPASGPVTVGYWLGDVSASTVERTVKVTYSATIRSLPANVSGSTFVNNAALRWNLTDQVAGTPPQIPAANDARSTATDTVTEVEPKVLIDKDVSVSTCDHIAAAVDGATDNDACNLAPDGSLLTYTLTVQNTGTSPAYDLRIVDNADLPGSAFASVTVTANGGATETDISIVDGDGLQFDYPGGLASGGVLTITYQMALQGSVDLSQLQQVINRASVPSYFGVSSGERASTVADYPARVFREYTENPADTDTITLHYPQPTIVKTTVSDATDARIGVPFTWQIVVGNTDTVAALNSFDVTDTLPAGWDYVPGSAAVTAVTGGATPPVGAIGDPVVAAQLLTWANIGNLPPSSSATIRFQATPNATLATAGTTGSFDHVNSATITGDDATNATANGNGAYTATDTESARIRRADLSLTKQIVTPPPYAFGQVVEYLFTITNQGPDASTGSTVSDPLPAGLGFVAVVLGSPTQGTFDATSTTWTVGPLASGSSATLRLQVKINAIGQVTNAAQINTADQFDIDSTPGNIAGTTPVEDDESAATIDVSPTSLGDRVWLDLNGDGVQDFGEPGIPNVTLTLLDAGPNGLFGDGDDGPTQTTTTGVDGAYLFTNLRIDRVYNVTVDTSSLPPGLAPTYDLDGTGTPNTATSTVPTLTSNLTVDFGYRGVGSIGDTVWYDLNNSGSPAQGAGEPGLPGIDLTITWAGFDGLPGTADDLVFPVTTNGAGGYLVGNLPFGDYLIDVVAATVPAGMVPTYDLDGTLTPNTAPRTLSAIDPNPRDVDFSYTGTGSLGDRVWLDTDGDGVQDAGEQGIPGLTVTLTWFGDDGVPGGGDDVVFTTVTGADGAYLFTHLPAGNFRVDVVPPAGVNQTFDLDGIATPNTASTMLTPGQARTDVDFGYQGLGSLGDTVWYDLDNSGTAVQDAGEPGIAGVGVTVVWAGVDGLAGTADDMTFTSTTAADGTYLVPSLPEGSYTVTVNPASVPEGMVPSFDLDGVGTPNVATKLITPAARNPRDVDFSYTGVGSLGDTLWFDQDDSGTATASGLDQPLPNVTVVVTWFGPDGLAGGGDDVVFVTVTGSLGDYLVPNLPYGDYSVVVQTSSLPVGLSPTFDLDGIATPNVASAALSAANPDELDVDFSYTGSGSIGDTIWLDLDGDGMQDPGEPGIPGVDVTLTYTGPGGTQIVITVTTDASGGYLFPNLPEGTFTVAVDATTLPPGVAQTFDIDGIVTPDSSSVVLSAGEHRTDVDFGYRGVASLGDQVWFDVANNGDGAFDAGIDLPLAGVAVTATWPGVDGIFETADDLVLTSTTAADGGYLFANLPFGEYRVVIDPTTLPAGLIPTFDLDGTATPDIATRILDAALPDARDVDFSYTGDGSIGDTVWHDIDGDGVIDAGEPKLSGVTVTVVWAGIDGVVGTADDVVYTAITGAAGDYLVPNLPAGTYTVSIDPVTLPAGFVPTYDLDGTTNRTTTFVLNPGQDRLDVDFGEREEADLEIVKSHPAGAVRAGDDVTYTIEVRNLGPGAARSPVEVVDTLPSGLTFKSGNGTGWTCNAVGQVVTCRLSSDLAALTSASPIRLTVATSFAAAPGVTNVATVSSTTPDPRSVNNIANDPTVVTGIDLMLSKDLLDLLVPDSNARYRLTVTNNGPSVAPIGAITLTDELPVGLTLQSASGVGFSCTGASNVVSCVSTAALAPGQSAAVEVVVAVAAGSAGRTVVNRATASSPLVDSNAVNDAATATATVAADLPRTGSDIAHLLRQGLAVVCMGGALLLVTRRRRRHTAA